MLNERVTPSVTPSVTRAWRCRCPDSPRPEINPAYLGRVQLHFSITGRIWRSDKWRMPRLGTARRCGVAPAAAASSSRVAPLAACATRAAITRVFIHICPPNSFVSQILSQRNSSTGKTTRVWKKNTSSMSEIRCLSKFERTHWLLIAHNISSIFLPLAFHNPRSGPNTGSTGYNNTTRPQSSWNFQDFKKRV